MLLSYAGINPAQKLSYEENDYLFVVLFTLLTTVAQSQTKAKTTTKPATKSATTAKSDAFTNKSVIDLHKGLGDEIILAKIAQSKCAFDLSTDGLIDLKSKGVSADVIKL